MCGGGGTENQEFPSQCGRVHSRLFEVKSRYQVGHVSLKLGREVQARFKFGSHEFLDDI